MPLVTAIQTNDQSRKSLSPGILAGIACTALFIGIIAASVFFLLRKRMHGLPINNPTKLSLPIYEGEYFLFHQLD